MPAEKSDFTQTDIKNIMKHLNINQSELALMLGVTRQTVWNYLHGYQIPLSIEKHLKLIDRVSRLLG